MTKTKLIMKSLLGATALTAFSAGTAFADGTAAGTSVDNTFTLDYNVGTVPQTQINNTGSPTSFTVDRKINLTVVSETNRTVVPGATNQTLVFKVTNTGNDTQGYQFTAVHEPTTDDFDAASATVTYYIDNGDNVFDAGTDTLGTFTSGKTSDLAADAYFWVVVTSDIDAGQTDGQTSDIALLAKTYEAGGSTTEVVADTGGNTMTGGAENVLADSAGSNDALADGDHSAVGTYTVETATLTGAKTVSVHSEDGTTCSTFPGTIVGEYPIPGACVEYVITVENSGSADAVSIDVKDTLPTDLTFVDAVASGFTGGTLSEPAANADCNAVSCLVQLTGATLSSPVLPATETTGTVTIRALVK